MSAQGSELIAYLTDYDETYAPKDGRAMRLTIVSDLVFIDVGKFTEQPGSDTFVGSEGQGVGVDAELLYHTLAAMLRRADRLALDQLNEGELSAKHPSLTTVEASLTLPAIRRRA